MLGCVNASTYVHTYASPYPVFIAPTVCVMVCPLNNQVFLTGSYLLRSSTLVSRVVICFDSEQGASQEDTTAQLQSRERLIAR